MDCAQVLPLARSHLGACLWATWRVISEEGDDDSVGLVNEKTTELVQPDFSGCVGRGLRQLASEFGGHGLDLVRVGRMGVGVVQCFEVFGQLKGRIDLVYVVSTNINTSARVPYL